MRTEAKNETAVKSAEMKKETAVPVAQSIKNEIKEEGENTTVQPAANKLTAEKKATTSAVKKTAKAEVQVRLEFAGRQIHVEDVIESAKSHYKALYAKEKGALKTLDVYLKPEENVAYYVANGEGSDDYKVGL